MTLNMICVTMFARGMEQRMVIQMTIKQAITELKDWQTAFSHMDKDMSYAIEAFGMAIKALSEQPEHDDEGTFWKKRANEYEALLCEITAEIVKGMTVDSIIINKDGIVLKDSQPERKGEWVKDAYGTVVCSECKGIRRDNRISHMNWCNSCGCRMIGEKAERKNNERFDQQTGF